MQERDNGQYYEDEIDLREIFVVLWRWKWVIAGVTLIFMVIAFLASKFLIDPVYQARAIVAPSSISSVASPSLTYVVDADDSMQWKMSENMDSLLQPQQVSIQNYNALLTSNYVIQKSKQALKLDQTITQIRSRVEVKYDKDTNTTEILVKGNNPEENSQLANALVEETITYARELNQQNIAALVKNIDSQLEEEERNLEESIAKYNSLVRGESLNTSVNQNRLEREVRRREQMVDLLSGKLMELELMQSYINSQNQVMVLSPATAPKVPVSPNTKLNTAIAGVLGFMLVIFAVFIIEYLRSDPKAKLSA